MNFQKIILLRQKLESSTAEELPQPLELKNSHNFNWEQCNIPWEKNYESNYYSISDDERTAISMGYGGTLCAWPYMCDRSGTFNIYFKVDFIGKTHSMGHGIGLIDGQKTQCHPKYGGFVVNSDTGEVCLNGEIKGKLYKKKKQLKVGDIICAKGNLKTDEFSLSLIRDGCKFGNEVKVIWNRRIRHWRGDTVRPAISFDTEQWSVTLL